MSPFFIARHKMHTRTILKVAPLLLLAALTGCKESTTVKDEKSLTEFAQKYERNTDVYLLVEQDILKCNMMVEMGQKTSFLVKSEDVQERLTHLSSRCTSLEKSLNAFRDDTSRTLSGNLIERIRSGKPVETDEFAAAVGNSTALMDDLVKAENSYLKSLKKVSYTLTKMTVHDLSKSPEFLKRAKEPQVHYLFSIIKSDLKDGQGEAAADKLLELMAVLYNGPSSIQ